MFTFYGNLIMELNIKNKSALITGGANGIGEDISEKLASEGVNIYITTRHKKNLLKLKKKLQKYNVKVDGIVLDFLKKDYRNKIEKFLKKIKIDILVNNAGHNLNVTDPYCSRKKWNQVLELNFFNTVEICNLVIPTMKQIYTSIFVDF